MLEAGASGYVLKGELAYDLISTIRATYLGKTVLSEAVARQILDSASAEAPRRFDLTDREIEVLRLMAEGGTTPPLPTNFRSVNPLSSSTSPTSSPR